MPRASHSRILHRTAKWRLVPIYAAILLLVFHTFLVAYVNSSFLEQFISAKSVGSIYTIGSALSVLIFLFISRLLKKVGNYRLTIGLLLTNFVAVLGMSQAATLEVAVPLFIVHLITVPLIIFNLDVFMEERIGSDESGTGSSRGLLLTLASLVGAASPLVSGLLIGSTGTDFTGAYLVSALTLIPVLIVLTLYFRRFMDPVYEEINVLTAIRAFWVNINIRSVFIAHFLLQMFFMMMVVYTPLYLTGTIGLTWAEFGIIMFFAQMAYVLLEYPIGVIADRYIGEKEMMAAGFLIIVIATAWMSFVTVASVLVWSVIMFTTRVGAALVEVTTESYFFKQTKSSDAQIISFFRVTRPLSYVLGAAIASLSLLYVPFNMLFIVFAILMIPAMFCTLYIQDSK
jgi:hypothetical protein